MHFFPITPPRLKHILCYISNRFEPTLGHSQRHDSNNTLSVKQSKTVLCPCWVCVYALKWADSLIIHSDLVIVCSVTAVTTGAQVFPLFMALCFLPRVHCHIPLLSFFSGFAVPSKATPVFNFIITLKSTRSGCVWIWKYITLSVSSSLLFDDLCFISLNQFLHQFWPFSICLDLSPSLLKSLIISPNYNSVLQSVHEDCAAVRGWDPTTSGYFPYAKQKQESPVTQGFVQRYI